MGGSIGNIMQSVVGSIGQMIPGFGPIIQGLTSLFQNISGFANQAQDNAGQEQARQMPRLQETALAAQQDLQAAAGALA